MSHLVLWSGLVKIPKPTMDLDYPCICFSCLSQNWSRPFWIKLFRLANYFIISDTNFNLKAKGVKYAQKSMTNQIFLILGKGGGEGVGRLVGGVFWPGTEQAQAQHWPLLEIIAVQSNEVMHRLIYKGRVTIHIGVTKLSYTPLF